MPSSDQIRLQIEQRIGSFPAFFRPGIDAPLVLESLWQQTLTAYLDNPLPGLFKEKLNAYLSRFCTVPYCMICHSLTLQPLCMTPVQVLALVESPPLAGSELLTRLRAIQPVTQAVHDPLPDEPALIGSAASVFLAEDDAGDCQSELKRILGGELYGALGIFIAYIKMCHTWVQMHPEIAGDADKNEVGGIQKMLNDEPGLAQYFSLTRASRDDTDRAALARDAQRQLDESLRSIFAGATMGMALCDIAGRFIQVNDAFSKITGYSREELDAIDFFLLIHAEDREKSRLRLQSLLMSEIPYSVIEKRLVRKDGAVVWVQDTISLCRDAAGSTTGVIRLIDDITERKLNENALRENARLLALDADVGIALATEENVQRMLQTCAEAMVKHLDAAFARVWTLNESEQMLELQASAGMYTHLNGPHGRVPVGAFKIGKIAQERKPHLTNSAIGDPRVADQEWAKREGMVAFAGYPLIVDERLLGVVAMFARKELSDVTLRALGSVANAIAIGIERKRGEENLRSAHEQTSEILESITDAFYAVDKEFNVTYVNRRTEEWLSKPRAELLGTRIGAAIGQAIGDETETYHLHAMSVNEAVMYQAVSPVNGKWIEVQIYPSRNGLSVYFRDISERREIEQRQTALFEHEHKIASQLQEALQPSIPTAVPGLALAKYYEAALNEASVGGDFYDVFAVEKGCTALVVGDLSGKGLAAAAQVSTVRNMLRATLYLGRTAAQAMTALNQILAENNLLTGFATLFVGLFESGDRTLTYVNCGQDPALIRRASTGETEPLTPTGTVIGALEGQSFSEKVVAMSPGDAIAIFTDGLTEAGPDRRRLLGVEGVAGFLRQRLPDEQSLSAGAIAEALTRQVIQGANTYAAEGIRDDICLVVAVVQDKSLCA